MRKRLFIVVAILALVLPLAVASCGEVAPTTTTATTTTITTTTTAPGTTTTPPGGDVEIEATEFMGKELTPINRQLNNALAGTQHIDRDTYILTVDGLVDNPLRLTYDDLLAYPQQDRLMDLDCVEGWSFTAKWTGPSLNAIFNDAGIKPEALIVIFYTSDYEYGYTSLDVSYVQENDIIIALKLNDITLPPERGFPFQVAAMSKWGYKWAKWVTRIELSSDANFRGYWESVGYSNNAEAGGPAFDR